MCEKSRLAKLRLLAIKSALKAPAEVERTITGINRYSNGYVAIVGKRSPHTFKMRVTEVHKEHLVGVCDDRPCCLKIEFLDDEDFVIGHFMPGTTLEYEDPLGFIIGRWIFLSHLIAAKESMTQRLFNMTVRFKRDRIAVLRQLVDYDINHDAPPSQRNESSLHGYFSDLYGLRAHSHPLYDKESRRLQLILESLVDSGDLVKREIGYRISGKAINTILEFETESKRHRIGVIQNWLLVVLTAVIAFVPFFLQSSGGK